MSDDWLLDALRDDRERAIGELLSVEAYRSIENAVCELDNTMEPFIKRKGTT